MAQLLTGRLFCPNTATGYMHSACRFLLVAILCCAGCDRGARKGKKGETEPSGRIAVGKLLIIPPVFETARGSAYDAGEGFVEQQLATLGGAEIRRQAEDFLQKNHPEIKPAPVNIQVARVKGSNIVSVIGRGESFEYNVALVDAVMEAFVIFVSPKKTEKSATFMADTNSAEKNLKEAERAWTAFRLEHDVSRLNAELSSMERRQKRFVVANSFYEQELDQAAKLTLEQEIRRRQISRDLPSEMPAELAALVRTTLTVAELAYLSALRGTNAPAAEAARKEAEKDGEERVRSIRKQVEIAGDLSSTAASEIARLKLLQMESENLQARHRAAESDYNEKKSREKNMNGGLNDSVHPVVSITEHPGKAKSD